MFANEFLLFDEITGLFKLLVHMFVEDIGVDGTLLILFIAAVRLLEVPPIMSFLSSIAAATFNCNKTYYQTTRVSQTVLTFSISRA